MYREMLSQSFHKGDGHMHNFDKISSTHATQQGEVTKAYTTVP